MDSTTSASAPDAGAFFTPAELCARWDIDPRTLAKIDLPWIALTPRVRRVPAAAVLEFEDRNPFYALWARRRAPASSTEEASAQ